MAKRKRLTPARPDMFREEGAGLPASDGIMQSSNYPEGAWGRSSRSGSAPIADVAGAAAAEAAVAEMADTLRTAREEGRLVLSLPRDQIDISYLVRDRISADEDEMTTLVESIRTRGQQTPIEVVALEDGRYGLISGWRRMQALQRLATDTGEPQFDTVLALLRRPEQSADAYVAMVEENEIRVGLSYYERARVAVRAATHGAFVSERAAVLRLFHAASRAKRSKIGSFITVVHDLDCALSFPAAISERTGLALARALETDPELKYHLREQLMAAAPETAEAEQAVLAAALAPAKPAQKQTLPAEKDSASVEVLPGLKLRTHRDGSLTLSGARVNPDLREALLGWLAEQNRDR